jgi:hydrogenase expression/formation protein HypC
MCLAVPGKIISIEDDTARVDINGVVTRANITLLDGLSVGDFVMVHAGFAIQKYDQDDAEETLRLFREIENRD